MVSLLFACIPVCSFFTALGLLFAIVMAIGAYNHDAPANVEPVPTSVETPLARSPWLLIAIIITLIVPSSVLLVIWLAPEW
jgi:hypothetical protein